MRRFVMLSVLGIAAAVAAATPPRILPGFDVTSSDGSTKQSAQIARNGKWLLVFVKSNCPRCETLLSALESGSTQDGSRVVIIVKAQTPNALAGLKTRYPHIANAAWYADVHAAAARSLDVPASPTAFGMRGSTVAWRMTGGISALPTDETSGIRLTSDPATDPKVRERTLLNGWLTQP
jgi:hypothetical protein